MFWGISSSYAHSRRTRLLIPLLAFTVCLCAASACFAEVGEGYLSVEGVNGGWHGPTHKGWIRIEARIWARDSYAPPNGTGSSRARGFFSSPVAPQSGPGQLVVAVDKRSTALSGLMAQCVRQARLSKARFAESSDDYRQAALELGDRPAAVPAFFEFTLQDVQFSECPIAADAPEQAFVLKFAGIEWTNFKIDKQTVSSMAAPGGRTIAGLEFALTPVRLPHARTVGNVRTFLVQWFGFAHDVSADQCPMMNKMPRPEDFGISLPEHLDDKQQNSLIDHRGPGKLAVCLLPGIAPDPGNASPQTKVARGLNLDGDDGAASPPARICRHNNFTSADGRTGIDNQFYSVAGCIAGLQGKKGLWQQVLNEERRSGAVTLLIQISGLNDERNNDHIDVTFLYSKDPPVKDSSGRQLLPDYTFRVSDKPEFTHYFARLHARMVDGVIETEPAKRLDFNLVKGPTLRLSDARIRLQITPEGNLTGILGGYENWRYLVNYYNSVGFEHVFGFQCPALYNAMRRAADGAKDPVTGECNEISVAYDIEAIPAFLPDSDQKHILAHAETSR